ncbi:MAG: Rha family transcriptional regulator [Azoarcus sp.]|jgi:Rha family phage regulatory protein|nr:Rha family transcriptional regulator [Azoarcus sp.]
MNTDLFPETLLVEVSDGRIFTTSLKVAEFSKKRHAEVLRAIETKLKALPAEFSQRNFASAEYLDRQKKPRHMCEMTEEGFALTMMGFTGKEAVTWQVGFIEAFLEMRRQLAALKEREAAALYVLRPRWKVIVEHPDYKRAALAALTGHKSPASITACRRRMREVGLLDG